MPRPCSGGMKPTIRTEPPRAELVPPVVAHVEDVLHDGRVVGEPHPGQRRLPAATGLQVEDPDHVDVGDPQPVALDPDALGLVEDLARGGEEPPLEDLPPERHLADPAL